MATQPILRSVPTPLDPDSAYPPLAATGDPCFRAYPAAALNLPMLLLGETGTGKSRLAELIHRHGPRADGPFVELNCAAIPEALFENEMFGAVRGGHGTATSAVLGKIAAAEGGTLFLDEVGDLSPSAQSKLLMFCQTSRYYPLGGVRECQADVRLIFATNRDLEEEVDAGRFRRDLLFRINVFEHRLPSLREQPETIAELARSLLADACQTHGLGDRAFTDGALTLLERQPWPGNVRQLRNAAERAAVDAWQRSSSTVGKADLMRMGVVGVAEVSGVVASDLMGATREFQRDFIARRLRENRGNFARTARDLGIARSYLYTLVERLGVRSAREDSALLEECEG